MSALHDYVKYLGDYGFLWVGAEDRRRHPEKRRAFVPRWSGIDCITECRISLQRNPGTTGHCCQSKPYALVLNFIADYLPLNTVRNEFHSVIIDGYPAHIPEDGYNIINRTAPLCQQVHVLRGTGQIFFPHSEQKRSFEDEPITMW